MSADSNKPAAVLAARIGSTVFSRPADWPSPDLDGLFDALRRWPLDRRYDFSGLPEFADKPGCAPFRGRAWGHCRARYDDTLQRTVFEATQPLYPEHPDAVRYAGDFAAYVFPFSVDTADRSLIERLDAAIAENLAQHARPVGTAA